MRTDAAYYCCENWNEQCLFVRKDSDDQLREWHGPDKENLDESVLEKPRCRSPNGMDSKEAGAPSSDPRRPDCRCCDSGLEATCLLGFRLGVETGSASDGAYIYIYIYIYIFS